LYLDSFADGFILSGICEEDITVAQTDRLKRGYVGSRDVWNGIPLRIKNIAVPNQNVAIMDASNTSVVIVQVGSRQRVVRYRVEQLGELPLFPSVSAQARNAMVI